MNVLVTTSTGTVGQHVVKLLLEKKVNVFAVVRNPKSVEAEHEEKLGAKLVVVDYQKPETLEAALKGIEKIVLISPFAADHQFVSEAWVSTIKKVKSPTLKHIVRLSTAGAEDPKHLVAKWHAFIEVLIKDTEIPCTFIRPNIFFQNLSSFFGVGIHHGQFISPLGKAKVAYLDARDVAKVIATVVISKVGDFQGQGLLLNGRKVYSGEDVAAVISKLTGNQVEYVDPPLEQWKDALQGNIPDLMLEAVVELYQAIKDSPNLQDTPDDSIKKITGEDAIDLEKYVTDHIDHFK